MPPVPSPPGSVLSEPADSLKVLGIGFCYIPVLPSDLYRTELLDFVEVTPEKLCRARWGGELSLDIVPRKFEQARAVCGESPIVVHGIELSIGSARGWNEGYLEMLDK